MIVGSATVAKGAQPRYCAGIPPIDDHVEARAAAKCLTQGVIEVFVAALHDDTEGTHAEGGIGTSGEKFTRHLPSSSWCKIRAVCDDKECRMKKFVLCLAAAVLWVAAPSAADTWKGTLSDSMCGAKHSAEKHGGDAKKHEACVAKCINNGGEYVFLANDKVYKISNQAFADLKTHAGHEVNLTGEMKGDSITVSKIEMPKKEGAK